MTLRGAAPLAGVFAALPVAFVGLWAASEQAEQPAGAAATAKAIRTKTGVEMVRIPAGWFDMGSETGHPDERPVHRVWVDAFYMDRYEVTQEQYGRLVVGNPSHFKGPRNPMEQVSWPAAALYCNARSRAEGFEPCYDEETAACDLRANGYRLPTEAEWEYACRAGTKGDYAFGRDSQTLASVAWYADNSGGTTHPVGRKSPNPWGLHDMHGNVAEWCNDVYERRYYQNSPARNPQGPAEGDRYVLRGGGWSALADECRAAYRRGFDPGFHRACFQGDDIGFRCVRSAGESESSAAP